MLNAAGRQAGKQAVTSCSLNVSSRRLPIYRSTRLPVYLRPPSSLASTPSARPPSASDFIFHSRPFLSLSLSLSISLSLFTSSAALCGLLASLILLHILLILLLIVLSFCHSTVYRSIVYRHL